MSNRLLQETSPYLLQHAHNPVDWYPWGEEAFARAREEDKPVLLSVGYSACHWCHVMEHESFEDPAIAAAMNEHFVNVKVDREERPDVDEVYMSAVQIFSHGRGGWPMTVFLTPTGKPFFAGTYFPDKPRHGMPSFPQVMEHCLQLFGSQREEVEEMSTHMVAALQQQSGLPTPTERLGGRWLEAVMEACLDSYDADHGGFGAPPKFPPCRSLQVLLAYAQRTGEPLALQQVTETLDGMSRGGMYDLLGGGFARYSVDEEWRIPHFEKMLYDNAQLVPLYVDGWRLTGKEHYRRIAEETLEYVLREMTLPCGGFCAAQDADSEGEEGKFFVWTPAQLQQALGEERGAQVALWLQVTAQGTFEHGTSVLRLERPLETLGETEQGILRDAFARLFAVRGERVAPARDDKIVAAWNGLMCAAFAQAGVAFQEPRYLEAARRCADCLLTTLTVEGRLHRSWKDERVGAAGFLDDYANTAHGLLALYQATLELRWLEESLRLADEMVALFWDDADGGFFYQGHDAAALVVRSKNLLGGAVPSGNGVAALLFAKLATLCGREDLGARADRILRSYETLLERGARALGEEALAGAWRTGAVLEIGVAGEAGPLLRECVQRYLPFSVVGHASHDALVPWMRGRGEGSPQETLFLCERGTCRLPSTDLKSLRSQLDDFEAREAENPEPLPEVSLLRGRVRAPALPEDPAAWVNTETPLGLAELRGRVVILDFWTYCCVNCLHVLPVLSALEKEWEGAPVSVVGIHSPKFPNEAARASVEQAVLRHGVRHPVVNDHDRALWDQYAIRAWPTLVVLDPTGRIAWQRSGEVSLETLRAVVEALLEESETTPARPPETSALKVVEGGVVDALRFPEKVEVWSPPSGKGTRLYVADTGHHRLLECALEEGEDGTLRARLLRVWGDGRPGLVDGTSPRFRSPRGVSRQGEVLWVADTDNHALRCVDLETGEVSTVAGNGELGRHAKFDPTEPLAMALRSPWDVLALEGNVVVAMAGTHQLWSYDHRRQRLFPIVGSGAEGHVDGAPLEAALAQPSALAVAGVHLFWLDSETSSVRALNLRTQQVTTLVGEGLFDFGDVDGTGAEVRLQHPLGLVSHGDSLYLADSYNHKLKRLRLATAEVTSLPCEGARLCEPGGLAVAGEWLIVADTNHHRLVQVHSVSGEARPLAIVWEVSP